jgi:hypothetical protein
VDGARPRPATTTTTANIGSEPAKGRGASPAARPPLTSRKRRAAGSRQVRAPYHSPPASEPAAQSAKSQPASARDPSRSAKAGMPISSAPTDTPPMASAATSTRMPGRDSAPASVRSPRAAGRQRREAAATANATAPTACIKAAVRKAAAGEVAPAIATTSSGPVTEKSSSWSASYAKAVSRRSRPTSSGHRALIEGDTGGVLAPSSTARGVRTSTPAPPSAATTRAESAATVTQAPATSTRVWPSRSTARPSSGAVRPTAAPLAPPTTPTSAKENPSARRSRTSARTYMP